MLKNRTIHCHCRPTNSSRHPGNWSSLSVRHPASPSMPLDGRSIWHLSNYLSHAGFTPVELLIAIAIVGILATIALPNVMVDLTKYRLNGAAQQVVGDLMAARMKAVSQNTKVKVFFTSENLYKICSDVDNNGTVDDCEGDGKIVDISNIFKGVNISSSGNNPIFYPRGNASNMTINI